MNAPQEMSTLATPVQKDPAISWTDEESASNWALELRRRAHRFRLLLEIEKVEPRLAEQWRLKLIHRALFSTWLDARAANAQ